MKKVLYVSLLISIVPLTLLSDIGLLTKVVDGDTVYFKDIKCRLAYIDTPESKHNDKAERDVSKCTGIIVDTEVEAGEASAKYTATLLQLGNTYKYDVIDIDRYDRKVCVIEANGANVNLAIVSGGYAVPYRKYIKDPSLAKLYDRAESDAKRNRSGLWRSHAPVMECMDK